MIVLVGFMGAGKTTVGRLLAKRLGWEFVDSDEVIEDAEGLSVADIFEGYGEAGFRRVEAEVITGLLAGPEVVLALGGGALGSAEVRKALSGHRVVLLDVALTEALERVASDPARPMLHKPNLSELYDSRQQTYREAAEVVISVSGRPPREIAADVLSALGGSGVGE